MEIITAKEMKKITLDAKEKLSEDFLSNHFESLYRQAKTGKCYTYLYRPNDMTYEVWNNIKKRLENLGYEVDENHYQNTYNVYWEREVTEND